MMVMVVICLCFYLDFLMIVMIIIFYLVASLMRKGAVSTATFPSTDFCLVNGGPIVAFSSSYAFCLCKCSVYGYIMNKAPIFPALIFAYRLSLYGKSEGRLSLVGGDIDGLLR